ncbi:GNAT family N-acetyltransferase [Sporichthya brevicatena]|uniref:GNAT family N-acetyltransferase n=1 Tax=Sporichthya brevicatena TaxID=171442 RepID=UPI0031DDDD77
MLRPATPADTDAVVALAHAEEVAWFGVAESSHEEIAHYLRFSGGVESGVVVDDGRVRAFALVTSTAEGVVILDPADPAPPLTAVYAWVRENGARHLEVQPRDADRIAWLVADGWTHTRSVFDLTMPTDAPLLGTEPVWPAGVALRPYDRGPDDAAVHHLIYVEADYASVPGHHDRPLEMWQQMHTAENTRGWVVHRDGRPVGWIVGRVQDDGYGWVHQLAVATSERGAGLGRALLLHSFAGLVAEGAEHLGLTVQASNDRAIGLYRSVGLTVQKEWLVLTR